MKKQKFPFTIEVNGPKGWEVVWEEQQRPDPITQPSRLNFAFNRLKHFVKDEPAQQFRLITPDV